MFNNASEGVAVSSDQNALAGFDVGNDDVVPVGQGTLDGQLQALGLWELVPDWAVLIPGKTLRSTLKYTIYC